MFSFNAVLRKMCGGFKGINLRKAEKSTSFVNFKRMRSLPDQEEVLISANQMSNENSLNSCQC